MSGLALLAGGTAIAAVAGGAHSIFATLLLGLLALLMGHSLLVEIQRQARRRMPSWGRHDTINAILLAVWAEAALISTILIPGSVSLRAVGLTLSLGYAGGCSYFVTERRRFLAVLSDPEPPALSHVEPPALSDSEPLALSDSEPLALSDSEPLAPHARSGGQDHDDRRDRHAVGLDR